MHHLFWRSDSYHAMLWERFCSWRNSPRGKHGMRERPNNTVKTGAVLSVVNYGFQSLVKCHWWWFIRNDSWCNLINISTTSFRWKNTTSKVILEIEREHYWDPWIKVIIILRFNFIWTKAEISFIPKAFFHQNHSLVFRYQRTISGFST